VPQPTATVLRRIPATHPEAVVDYDVALYVMRKAVLLLPGITKEPAMASTPHIRFLFIAQQFRIELPSRARLATAALPFALPSALRNAVPVKESNL
jgi:hypothetical protein